jgi:hypothetical protein
MEDVAMINDLPGAVEIGGLVPGDEWEYDDLYESLDHLAGLEVPSSQFDTMDIFAGLFASIPMRVIIHGTGTRYDGLIGFRTMIEPDNRWRIKLNDKIMGSNCVRLFPQYVNQYTGDQNLTNSHGDFLDGLYESFQAPSFVGGRVDEPK